MPEQITGVEMFDRYVQGELCIPIDAGELVIRPTAKDKLRYIKLRSDKNRGVEDVLAYVVSIVKREYPQVSDEKVEALVLMEQEAISRELLAYFKIITKEEYDEQVAKAKGTTVKKNDKREVPSGSDDGEKERET